jgi:hypothetical protein
LADLSHRDDSESVGVRDDQPPAVVGQGQAYGSFTHLHLSQARVITAGRPTSEGVPHLLLSAHPDLVSGDVVPFGKRLRDLPP